MTLWFLSMRSPTRSDNSSIFMKEVIKTSVLTRKTNFFKGCSCFKFNNLRLAIGMALKFCTTQRVIKTKSQKALGAFCPPSPPIIPNLKHYACTSRSALPVLQPDMFWYWINSSQVLKKQNLFQKSQTCLPKGIKYKILLDSQPLQW